MRFPWRCDMNEAYFTTKAMLMSGVPFLVHLANAYRTGSELSQSIIRRGWPDYWAEYSDIGKEMKAEDDAKDGVDVVGEMLSVLTGEGSLG